MTATPTPDDGAALLSSIIECLLHAQRALEPIITTRLAIEGFPKDATAIGEARVAVDAAVEAWNTRSPAPVSGEAGWQKVAADLAAALEGCSLRLQVCLHDLNGEEYPEFPATPPSPLENAKAIAAAIAQYRQHCAGAGRG